MISKSKFLIVYALLTTAVVYLNLHSDITVPTNKPLAEFPAVHQGWRMVSRAEFSENVLKVLKPTDYLSRQYVGPDGARVNLYIGYHGGGKGSGGIHSPKNCLPGSGWYHVSTAKAPVGVAGNNVNLVQSVYVNGENKELFLYWFQVRGKSLTDEYSLKLAEILNSMFHRRRDSTFVRVSVPFETDQARATAAGEGFVRDFYPVIRGFLPI